MTCGRCHKCRSPIRRVLDGEEWCTNCGEYQRPVDHGWSQVGASITDRLACTTKEREIWQQYLTLNQPFNKAEYHILTFDGDYFSNLKITAGLCVEVGPGLARARKCYTDWLVTQGFVLINAHRQPGPTGQ